MLSGPSTGVVAAQAIGGMAGIADLITFDMGGTSTDVALLRGGVCRLANEAVVHGYPIKAPMLDIHTVGAGGGSIAHVDSGGLLKVGPRSAGADPRTGLLRPRQHRADRHRCQRRAANAESRRICSAGGWRCARTWPRRRSEGWPSSSGSTPMATAQGIVSVVTANMARAIRVISVQRGYDPRDYTLAAFGGAGPLHAARLAKELDIARILVPRHPGILCAMGLLLTDLRADFAATRLLTLADAARPAIEDVFAGLAAEAAAWFAEAAVGPAERRVQRAVDMRYAGQNYELSVPVPDGPITGSALDGLAAGFADAHRRMYGFVAEGEPVQLVTFRIEASGLVRKAAFRPRPEQAPDASAAIVGRRDVWLPEADRFVSCPVYDRDRLDSGHRITGPAIVEQMDATTVILPGMTARVEPHLNLILELA